MQKHVNLVDLVKSFPTNIYLKYLASIQKRTSPVKFGHLAEKSGKGSISNLSTKVQIAGQGNSAEAAITGQQNARTEEKDEANKALGGEVDQVTAVWNEIQKIRSALRNAQDEAGKRWTERRDIAMDQIEHDRRSVTRKSAVVTAEANHMEAVSKNVGADLGQHQRALTEITLHQHLM